MIMRENLGVRKMDDGRIQILVDPYRLRKAVGKYGHDKLWERIKDLKAAILELFIFKRGDKYLCSILDEIKETDSRIEKDPRSSLMKLIDKDDDGGGRRKWRFTFSGQWSEFIQNDIGRFYNPAFIINLRHGISQALARHVFSHQDQPNGGWDLETLIQTVGAGGRIRDRRSELAADHEGLKKIGIFIVDGKVRRDHMPDPRDHMPGK
ncbi:MAG: hypothetical protein KGI54_07675 [Pseudomonadota bacterium]|nr:hypothetical protein [Pseudomonadota bacterium]